MKYSREFIESVLSSAQLVDVVSQYTLLKPAGKNLVGRCPFPDHKEKSPSFHVSVDKQVYHCFGCKKGGNIFSILNQLQGLGFVEAVEYLALRASIPLPVADQTNFSQDQKYLVHKRKLAEINQWAADYFVGNLKQLPTSHRVREYVRSRKLKPESIETFHIGYSNEDWEGLVHYLKQKGASLSLAEELGLIKRRESGGYFDLFRDRLTFTIKSQVGDVIGFGGRSFEDVQPKYLNSPESPLFHKGKTLFGLDQTSRHIRSQDEVIIVEGYIDLISMFQSGFKNIVAPLGTALTIDQCRILSKITKNVIVLFDGDSAGQNAAERSLPILFEAGLIPKCLVLPEGMDPDEYLLTHGPEQMREQLVSSQDLFSVILKKWMDGFSGGSADKVKLVQRVKPLVENLKDQSLKSLYLKELSRKLGVDFAWMRRAVQDSATENGTLKNQIQSPLKVPNKDTSISESEVKIKPQSDDLRVEKINLHGAPKWELLILALGLNSTQKIWDQILHADVISQLVHPGVRLLFERIMTLTGQSGLRSDNLFVLITNEILNPDLLTVLIKELPSNDVEGEARLLTDCIRKVRIGYLDLQLKKLAQELKQNPTQEKWEQLANLQKERLRSINLNPLN